MNKDPETFCDPLEAVNEAASRANTERWPIAVVQVDRRRLAVIPLAAARRWRILEVCRPVATPE